MAFDLGVFVLGTPSGYMPKCIDVWCKWIITILNNTAMFHRDGSITASIYSSKTCISGHTEKWHYLCHDKSISHLKQCQMQASLLPRKYWVYIESVHFQIWHLKLIQEFSMQCAENTSFKLYPRTIVWFFKTTVLEFGLAHFSKWMTLYSTNLITWLRTKWHWPQENVFAEWACKTFLYDLPPTLQVH